MHKLLVFFLAVASMGAPPQTVSAFDGPVYLRGHADIGVEYLAGPPRLSLNIRLDGDTQFSEGNDLSLQVVSANAVAIRVPDPPLFRQHFIGDPIDPDDDYNVTGPQWDFLGVEQDAPFWFLPQSSDPQKPFFGFATDGLRPSEWLSAVTWSLERIVSAPPDGEVSLWQTNLFGLPTVHYASFGGIELEGDSFTQSISGHDHYNWGFSAPGVYQVELGARAERVGVGAVEGTAIFTFLVGDFTSQAASGDFNDDGIVDAADYAVWRDSIGLDEDSQALSGNGTGGLVDEQDYLLWQECFDFVHPASVNSSPVPEPIASWLLCAATIVSGSIHRCRQVRGAPSG